MSDVPLFKKCTMCKEKLTLNKFGKRTASHDGLQARCRKCIAITNSRDKTKVNDYVNKNMYNLNPKDY